MAAWLALAAWQALAARHSMHVARPCLAPLHRSLHYITQLELCSPLAVLLHASACDPRCVCDCVCRRRPRAGGMHERRGWTQT
jgi:hypothetical protein